jgi:glycosyltransferase involved in cell wall biosynthesis
MGWLGRTLALDRQLPLLGTYHTSLAESTAERTPAVVRNPIRRATWTFLRKFYEPCRQVLCPTNSIVEELRRNGFKNRLGIFTRGIDSKVFSPLRPKSQDAEVTIGYVGRLAPEKNVRALPELVSGTGARCMIVGDGPERPFLQRSLPNAIFTGYLQGDELATAYSQIDILVFPSLTDTFGNVVLEAMASGAVPVVLKAPGPSDFVESGVNAFVSSDVKEMRHHIGLLMSDPHLRQTMAEKAVQFAQSRDWAAVFDRLVDDYRSSAES